MPVFNGAPFLREALKSILNQGVIDFEFIIINDGSTDDSEKIISEYERRDHRIRFINNEQNSGLIEVLNEGLSVARGKYVARMDADDVSLPNRFAAQSQFLDNHPEIGVVGSNVHFIDSSGRRISNFVNNPRLPQTPNQIKWSLCFSCCLMHPTIMARRELLIKAGGYNKIAKHAEDYDLWVRMSDTTDFYNLPQKLLLLRRHKTNITTVHIDTTLANSLLISQRRISSILGYDITFELIEILWHYRLFKQSDIFRIIGLFNELLLAIQRSNQLTVDELGYIKRDISKRVTDYFTQNITEPEIKSLLTFALKIDLIESIKMILLNLLRSIWRIIKMR